VLHYRVEARHGVQRLDIEVVLLAKIAESHIVEVVTVPFDPEMSERFWAVH
jgi:hypothetical protein